MTTPSIKFVCPKCGKEELNISDDPCYCYCVKTEKIKRGWSFSGPTSPKMKSRKVAHGTRMKRVK